jgi:hypothetical protein
MCYFSLSSIGNTSLYSDKINVNPSTAELYSNVYLYGTLSADSYITVWKSGVKVFNNGYGTMDVFVKQPSFSVGFIADTLGGIGTYTATIMRGGINKSFCNFTIIDAKKHDYQVYASPNPYIGLADGLNISWIYKYTGGVKGAVVYSRLSYFDSANFYAIETGIEGNGSQTIYNLEYGNGAVYLYLLRVLGNGSFEVKDTYVLMLGTEGGMTSSEIYATPVSSTLKKEGNVYVTRITIYGRNGMLSGVPVWICLNGFKFHDVSTLSDFEYKDIWGCYNSGVYTVSLMTLDSEGNPYTTLAITKVTVYGYGSTIPGETPETPSLLYSIPSEFKILIGVILTVVFTLIPLIVTVLLKIKSMGVKNVYQLRK